MNDLMSFFLTIVEVISSISIKEIYLLISGAILSVILAVTYDILKKLPWKKENRRIKKLLGRYYGYHLHTDNSGKIIESIWIIEKKLFKKLSIFVEHPNLKNEYLYKGSIRFYQSHLYFNLCCITKPEEMHFVFHRPQSGQINIELGTAICIGQTGNPYAGFQIISKYQLSNGQVYKIFGFKRTLVVGDKEIMRVQNIEIKN